MKDSDLVWYAGYGSNLSENRFSCYISGGVPEGGSKVSLGCRNKSKYLKDVPHTISHELYFANSTPSWNGGSVAFIDDQSSEKHSTLVRLYLVTFGQMEDIAFQENNVREFYDLKCDQSSEHGKSVFLTHKWYGCLLYLGTREGYPIFTVTAHERHQNINAPHPEYLRTIIRGIKESHSLSDQVIINYLKEKLGMETYSENQIQKLIESVPS